MPANAAFPEPKKSFVIFHTASPPTAAISVGDVDALRIIRMGASPGSAGAFTFTEAMPASSNTRLVDIFCHFISHARVRIFPFSRLISTRIAYTRNKNCNKMSNIIQAGVDRVVDALTDTLKDIIHCLSCKRKCEVKDAVEFRAKNGRLMVTGICIECGHKVTSFKRKRKCLDESCEGCAPVEDKKGDEDEPPLRSSGERAADAAIDEASLAATDAAAAAVPPVINSNIFSEEEPQQSDAQQ